VYPPGTPEVENDVDDRADGRCSPKEQDSGPALAGRTRCRHTVPLDGEGHTVPGVTEPSHSPVRRGSGGRTTVDAPRGDSIAPPGDSLAGTLDELNDRADSRAAGTLLCGTPHHAPEDAEPACLLDRGPAVAVRR